MKKNLTSSCTISVVDLTMFIYRNNIGNTEILELGSCIKLIRIMLKLLPGFLQYCIQ